MAGELNLTLRIRGESAGGTAAVRELVGSLQQATRVADQVDARFDSIGKSVAGFGRAQSGLLLPLSQLSGEVTKLGTNSQSTLGAVEQGSANAGRGVEELGKRVQDTDRKTQAFGKNADSVFRAISIGLVAQQVVQPLSQLQSLNVRLETLTETSERLADAQDFLRSTAERHHKSILDLADGYTKLLTLENSGILTQQQSQDILRGLSNAQSATGASAAQLGQVMFGLAQALSSGTVRAEELNQVTEPLPGLLQAMDRASGNAAGGLRRLVNDGQVTSDMFARILVEALRSYEGAADRTGKTIQAKFADIRTSYLNLLAVLEKPIAAPLTTMLDGWTLLIREFTNAIAQLDAQVPTTLDGITQRIAEVERLGARPNIGEGDRVRLAQELAALEDARFKIEQKARDDREAGLQQEIAAEEGVRAKLAEERKSAVDALTAFNDKYASEGEKLAAEIRKYEELARRAGLAETEIAKGIERIKAASAKTETTSSFGKGEVYRDAFLAAARARGLDPGLLPAIAQEESGFNPNAVSVTGATGLLQFTKGTAHDYGLKDRTDPLASIEAASRLLAHLLTVFRGNLEQAIAAYKAGEGAVKAAITDGVLDYDKLKAIQLRDPRVKDAGNTQNYVANVLRNSERFGGNIAFDPSTIEVRQSALRQAEQERQRLATESHRKVVEELRQVADDEKAARAAESAYRQQLQANDDAAFAAGQERQKQLLEQGYEQKLISAQDYYTALQRLADEQFVRVRDAIDREIDAERRKLATLESDTADYYRSQQRIADLQGQRGQAQAQYNRFSQVNSAAQLDAKQSGSLSGLGSELTNFSEEYNRRLGDMSQVAFTAASGMQNAFAEFFASGFKGTQSLGDAFAAMIQQMVSQILAMMAMKAVMSFIGMLGGLGSGFSGVSPTSAELGGGVAGVTFPGAGLDMSRALAVHHAGGIVGQRSADGRVMPIPAAVLAAIPLRPDERLIIGQQGEEVLTRSDPRHRDSLAAPFGRFAMRYHSGGIVGLPPDDLAGAWNSRPAAATMTVNQAGDSYHISIPVSIDNSGNGSSDPRESARQARQLGDMVGQELERRAPALIQREIARQKRDGGSLHRG
ncbi:MAG: tape measure protein [Methylotetracoccus sp.]